MLENNGLAHRVYEYVVPSGWGTFERVYHYQGDGNLGLGCHLLAVKVDSGPDQVF